MMSSSPHQCWWVLFFLFLSMFSLGFKALCIVISFLVFSSIYLSSSFIYFKNAAKYLRREGQISCFSLWWDSCCRAWFLIVFTSKIPKYLLVSFPPSVLILPWFGSSFPTVISLFLLLIICMAHFSLLNSIPTYWLYILIACIHHHVMPSAWISLTLSCYPSLSSIAYGRFSRLHPVSAQSCCLY